MIQIKDRPQPQLLLDELQTEKFGRTNAFFQELGSTNSYIKQNVQVLESGFTAVANLQTGGRGRLGKTFESPSGGLYMSLLVKDLRSEDISSATDKSAVAVSEALEDFLGLEHETLGIKWVNDILYDGKKVCGILCELVRDANYYGMKKSIILFGHYSAEYAGMRVLAHELDRRIVPCVYIDSGEVYEGI